MHNVRMWEWIGAGKGVAGTSCVMDGGRRTIEPVCFCLYVITNLYEERKKELLSFTEPQHYIVYLFIYVLMIHVCVTRATRATRSVLFTSTTNPTRNTGEAVKR